MSNLFLENEKKGLYDPVLIEKYFGGIGCLDDNGKFTPCLPNIPDNPTIHYFKVEAIVQMQRWDFISRQI